MFECHAFPAAQLLVVSFSQYVNVAEMTRVLDAVRASLAELQPGFRMLSDYTELIAMDPDCAPALAKLMDECTEEGVSEVHRAIADPKADIGLAVISAFHLGHAVHVVEHSTLEEALQSVA